MTPDASSFSVAGEEDPGAAQSEPPVVDVDALASSAAARSADAMRVSDIDAIARSRLHRVQADTLLVEVAAGLASAELSVVVVCGPEGEPLGVVTETLIVRQLGLGQADLFSTRAADVMSTSYATCTPEQSLPELIDAMHAQGLMHVLVVDDAQRVQGIVYPRDGLRALLGAGHAEESLLRQYVMGVGYR